MMPELYENINRGLLQHISLDVEVGELLRKAKDAFMAGGKPDASLAPAINAKNSQAKALALNLGRMLMHAEPDKVQRALGGAYSVALVAAYIGYARNPDPDNYDKILDAVLALIPKREGRFGYGWSNRK